MVRVVGGDQENSGQATSHEVGEELVPCQELERAFAEDAKKQAAVTGTSVDDELLQMSPYRVIEFDLGAPGES